MRKTMERDEREGEGYEMEEQKKENRKTRKRICGEDIRRRRSKKR